MKLSELRTLQPLPETDAEERNQLLYDRVKESAKTIVTSGSFRVMEYEKYSDMMNWFLVEGDKVVGMFKFSNNVIVEDRFWIMNYAWISQSNRGRGLAKAIYEMFIKKYGSIASDFEQTIDSQRIWRSLFSKYNCYGAVWNADYEQEWVEITSLDELSKAWPPEEKYTRLVMTSNKLRTKVQS